MMTSCRTKGEVYLLPIVTISHLKYKLFIVTNESTQHLCLFLFEIFCVLSARKAFKRKKILFNWICLYITLYMLYIHICRLLFRYVSKHININIYAGYTIFSTQNLINLFYQSFAVAEIYLGMKRIYLLLIRNISTTSTERKPCAI